VNSHGNLTEAQKLLLQKFPNLPEDDPLIELAAWNASLEKKVDDFGDSLNTWTQAILKQTDLVSQQSQLIVSQNLILQKTGQTNESLGRTLLQWKQGSSELQKEFESLKDTISGQGDALKNLSDRNQGAIRKLDDLNQRLKFLEAATVKKTDNKTDNLATSVSNLTKGLSFSQAVLIVLGACIFGIQIMQMVAYKGLFENMSDMGSAVQTIQERTGWALTKLERLEKR
jgi:uncharacterized protein YukE